MAVKIPDGWVQQLTTGVHAQAQDGETLTSEMLQKLYEQIQLPNDLLRQQMYPNQIYPVHYYNNAETTSTQPEAERTTGMNNSLAIFLISDAARAIQVSYDPDDKAPNAHWTFKTLDPNIKVDDYVIVETDTRHKMTVVKVLEVDVDVDYDSSINYKWIIGTVLKEDFDKLKDDEAEAIKVINSAEKTKRRDELREAIAKNAEGKLQSLPFYTPPTPAAKEE